LGSQPLSPAATSLSRPRVRRVSAIAAHAACTPCLRASSHYIPAWRRYTGFSITLTCKCLPHLSLAWKQDYHEDYDQSSVDGAAYFAPALCGRTFFAFLLFPLLTQPCCYSWQQNAK